MTRFYWGVSNFAAPAAPIEGLFTIRSCPRSETCRVCRGRERVSVWDHRAELRQTAAATNEQFAAGQAPGLYGAPNEPTNTDSPNARTIGRIWVRELQRSTMTSRGALTAQKLSMCPCLVVNMDLRPV